MAFVRVRLGAVRRTDIHPGKVRHPENGFHRCHRNPDDHCAAVFLGNGVYRRVAKPACRAGRPVAAVSGTVGACHGRKLAVLLPRASGRPRQRRRSRRQAEHSGYGPVLLSGVSRAPYAPLGHRPCRHCRGHAADADMHACKITGLRCAQAGKIYGILGLSTCMLHRKLRRGLSSSPRCSTHSPASAARR